MSHGGDSRSAISLFTGAGGMDRGFSDAGFEILLANDIDADACQTYRKNHDVPILEGDIDSVLGEVAKYAEVDLVFGGPPCQGFSVAGKMDPNDERNALIWRFLDVVAFVRPQAFVCENVKALATLRRWTKTKEDLLARGRRPGQGLNYATDVFILNSVHFGVPQGRERMFLIGIKNSSGALSSDDFQRKFMSLLDHFKLPAPKIKGLFEKLGPAGTPNNNRICNARVVFARKPILRRSPYAGMLFNGAGRPINPETFSCTLPATMGGNKTPIIDEGQIFHNKPSWVEEYHRYLLGGGTPHVGEAPSRLRRLTVDECLAIQTFPVDYKLAGSRTSMYRQIGNAVPMNLAKAVAKAVSAFLD